MPYADTFDRLDGPIGISSSGHTYTVLKGGRGDAYPKVVGNKCLTNDSGSFPPSMAVADGGLGHNDATVTWTLVNGQDSWAIYFRVTDVNNYWVLTQHTDVEYVFATGGYQFPKYVELIKVVNGSVFPAWTITAQATELSQKIVFHGSTINYFNGNVSTPTKTVTDSFNAAATKIGIGNTRRDQLTSSVAGAAGSIDQITATPSNAPPNAPTISAPINTSSVNVAAGFGVTFRFKDPNADNTMGSWGLRRKVTGAAAYEYWNVSLGAWQSTVVWNAGTTTNDTDFTYNFSSGIWLNGFIYNLGVAVRDAGAAASQWSSDTTFTGGLAPTVIVTRPSGTVANSSQPTVEWTFFDPENDPQATYEVKIFEAATYNAVGFDPATTTPLLHKVETADANARTWVPSAGMANGGTYRAYVRASQAGSQYTDWVKAFSQFTLNLVTPVAPGVTVTPNEPLGQIIINITGNDTGPTFTRSNTYFTVEYTEDSAIVIGPELICGNFYLPSTKWQPIRGGEIITPALVGVTTVADNEAFSGVSRIYRATTKADV